MPLYTKIAPFNKTVRFLVRNKQKRQGEHTASKKEKDTDKSQLQDCPKDCQKSSNSSLLGFIAGRKGRKIIEDKIGRRVWGSKVIPGRVRDNFGNAKSENKSKCLSIVTHLPEELQLQVLSFIHDKISTVETIIEYLEARFPPEVSFLRLSSPLKMSKLPSAASLSALSRRPFLSNDGCQRLMANVIMEQDQKNQCKICPSLEGASDDNDDDTINNAVFCHLCTQPICYPYRLVGCGHEVCGMCAWRQHDHSGACACGVTIRHRPQQLTNFAAERRAYWLLNDKGKYYHPHFQCQKCHFPNRISNHLASIQPHSWHTITESELWYHKNELRVFKGSRGFFGINGRCNRYDPFSCIRFEGDFDHLPTIDISGSNIDRGDENYTHDRNALSSILHKGCRRLSIVLRPAHENYRSYYIEDVNPTDLYSRSFRNREWLRHISNEDIVTLVEEEPRRSRIGKVRRRKKVQRDRLEARLIGWEDNVGFMADYDWEVS